MTFSDEMMSNEKAKAGASGTAPRLNDDGWGAPRF
jgi:hypothetical protein